MNHDQWNGRLELLVGHLKTYWGNLTDAPALIEAGRQAKFAGKIRVRRGLSAATAERQLDEFLYRHRHWKTLP